MSETSYLSSQSVSFCNKKHSCAPKRGHFPTCKSHWPGLGFISLPPPMNLSDHLPLNPLKCDNSSLHTLQQWRVREYVPSKCCICIQDYLVSHSRKIQSEQSPPVTTQKTTTWKITTSHNAKNGNLNNHHLSHSRKPQSSHVTIQKTTTWTINTCHNSENHNLNNHHLSQSRRPQSNHLS
jgi:hypothetical protein